LNAKYTFDHNENLKNLNFEIHDILSLILRFFKVFKTKKLFGNQTLKKNKKSLKRRINNYFASIKND
jgi:hypothetical protein